MQTKLPSQYNWQEHFLDILLTWSEDIGETVINLHGDVHTVKSPSSAEILEISRTILDSIFDSADKQAIIGMLQRIIHDIVNEIKNPKLQEIAIQWNDIEKIPIKKCHSKKSIEKELKNYRNVINEIFKTLFLPNDIINK